MCQVASGLLETLPSETFNEKGAELARIILPCVHRVRDSEGTEMRRGMRQEQVADEYNGRAENNNGTRTLLHH